jgi:alkanesulfonate monooxygenase SsuD/methylene tetrahydromethanopterin reductase-like flavin-dependent oxidoreductase (luciferase family)
MGYWRCGWKEWTAMHFGLALDLGTMRTRLDRALEEFVPLIRLAERWGFESVWAGEAYPTGPGAFHLPSPLLALAALAPQTSLQLGTGVTLLPTWQPLKLAYDAAVMDQLSGGRFVLGVGAGNRSDWARFGADRATLGDWLDETLAFLRALWAGEPGYRGRLLSTERGIAPLPVQAGGPPLWVGGLAPRAARRAARFGDAWYASTSYHLREIREQVARYRAALAALGKDPATAVVSVNRLAFLAETPERALEQADPYVEAVLRRYAGFGGLQAPDGRPLSPAEARLETVADVMCLVGSPETVSALLAEYAAAGVTHVQLRVAPGDLPAELAAQTITLAGEQLIAR